MEWEGGESRLPLPYPGCSLTRFPCDCPCTAGPSPLALHRPPQTAGRGLQRGMCWGMQEPAVGPLTSFQSLPFINIYRSSSTKNNILEPREEKKNKCKAPGPGIEEPVCQSRREP